MVRFFFRQLLGTLKFLAQGSYQRNVGADFNVGVAQSTFSEILEEVVNVMIDHLCPRVIVFPSDDQDIVNITLR